MSQGAGEGQLGPPGEGHTRRAQDKNPSAAPGPASCIASPVAGEETEAQRPFALCWVGGFAREHRGFLGYQPIPTKPVPRHRHVPAHAWGPLGLGQLEMCLQSGGEWGLVLGPCGWPLPHPCNRVSSVGQGT